MKSNKEKLITIVDYGMGNIGSIANMIKKIGCQYQVANNEETLKNAKKIILPGVGAFDQGMLNLRNRGMLETLNELVLEDGIPILGICLGMQLMTRKSEEGNEKGLSWFNAETVRFNFSDNNKLKVPHMGWNEIKQKKKNLLLDGLPENPIFYFVHSYYVVCNDKADILATTRHGIEYTSIICRDHMYGAQFHPEKSHKYGLSLLSNFSRYT